MMRSSPLLATVLGVLVLAGCGSEPPPAPAAAPAKKAAAPAAAAAAAPAAPAYVYRYNPIGKRDPFRSPETSPTRSANAENPCTDPLCQFDLDQLTLVAVVTGDANPIAMVEDPQGRGFIIRRNSKMGKQGGKVTNILRDSVVVTEFWQQPDGKVQPNPVSLKLKTDTALTPAMDLQTGQYQQ